MLPTFWSLLFVCCLKLTSQSDEQEFASLCIQGEPTEQELSTVKIAMYRDGKPTYYHMNQTGLNQLSTDVDFDSSRRLTVWFMGYATSKDDFTSALMIKSYAALKDMNVMLLVTTELLSDPLDIHLLYTFQKSNYAYYIGKIFAEFLLLFVRQGFVSDSSKIHFVGHSFGAQVAGVAGTLFSRLSQSMVGRVTGLDPIGHCFYLQKQLLTKASGTHVDIYYNSIASLGTLSAEGHLNVYLNNGILQPGCDLMDLHCQHDRVVEFWTESIYSDDCIATPADNYLTFLEKYLTKSNTVRLKAGFKWDGTPQGKIYFLQTRNAEPYCLGESGINEP